jgi:hypothetical protein
MIPGANGVVTSTQAPSPERLEKNETPLSQEKAGWQHRMFGGLALVNVRR